MSVLDQICSQKKTHIAQKKSHRSIEELADIAKTLSPPRGFIKTLRKTAGPALIAEIKKASPSKGLIREGFDPKEIAQIYKQNGASCLSVLTDEPYFQGHDDDFKMAHQAVDLPILRKDFMLDPYQIYESRALGADCILSLIHI